MLNIGKIYRESVDGQARICADISLNGKGITLWFGVDESQKDYLCDQRSDAFVMAMLPAAMRGKHNISCQTPMSERLHYQLENYLIPTLSNAGDLYHTISIEAPLLSEPVANQKAVGTGFSGGVDCLYTIMTHEDATPFALTDLAVFNVGAFEGADMRKNFHTACVHAKRFADEQGYGLVCLDSNIEEILPERFLDVYSLRNLAGAMALQGLFSVYLLSSGHAFGDFQIDLRNASTFDLLTISCAQTETLAVYSSGGQVHRYEKLKALAEWEPAHRWTHPCFRKSLHSKNCGHCKKCIHTMTVLYALGVLDRFEAVFDVDDYIKSFPQHVGYLLVMQERDLYKDALQLLEANNIPIPPQAYEEAEALRKRGRNAIHTKTEQTDTLRALAQKLRKNKIGG